jgi:hypothetical protein
MLAWQLQQDAVYHDDVHLRDKPIVTFSTYSKQLNESFKTKRPKTSNQVLQRVQRNCSYELGIDLLPDRNADVLRTDVKVNYLTYKLRGHSTASHSTKKNRKKGPRAGCWVCKQRDHYASERHTDDEIAAAKAQGKSVIDYATELATSSPKRALRVLNAHVAFLEASSSSESNSADTDDDDDVADVSNANVTRAPVVDAHVDAFHRSCSLQCCFRFNNFFSWFLGKGHGERAENRVSQKTLIGCSAVWGIVLDSACTGASVVSSTEYKRYRWETGAEYSIDPNSCGYVRFGDADVDGTTGRLKSLGTAKIRGYAPKSDELFDFFVTLFRG